MASELLMDSLMAERMVALRWMVLSRTKVYWMAVKMAKH